MYYANWIDVVALLALAIYAIQGFQRGFAKCMSELVSFLAALFLAMKFFGVGSYVLQKYFFIPENFSKVLGFFVIWALSLWIFILVFRHLLETLKLYSGNLADKILGILPSIVNGFITLGVVFTLIVTLPVASATRKDILSGKISGFLVKNISSFENALEADFGGALGESLSFFSIQTGETKFVELGYKAEHPVADEEAENKMLEMINEERKKAGLNSLVTDPALRSVARKHSEDMFVKGYFSHVTPEKKTLADRLIAGNVRYIFSGENLALAPSVEVAMEGLMNSPGHKKNILSENYGKVGIGAMDGGQYGIMFTQNFSD